MRWVLIGLLSFIPTVALAADTGFFGPIVPACAYTAGDPCQACDLVKLAENILRVMISLAVMAAALMFAYAGILYVTAAANRQNLESARKIFFNVLIGLVFVLVAYLIIDLIMHMATNQSFRVLSNIQCVRVEHRDGSMQLTVVPPNNPVNSVRESERDGSTFVPPEGSCAAISEKNAETFGSTPNCNPAERVENYGNGAAGIKMLRDRYGNDITQCAQRVGINENIIYTIAVLECGGKSTCNDPAPVEQCKKGNGATGISCDGVGRYCAAYPSDPNCGGYASMTDAQKAQKIASTPQLAFCATGMSMRDSHRAGEDWSTTATRYNGGEGALEASVSCPGYSKMQCPIADPSKEFPWCHITCAYNDSFNNIARTAGGI